MTMLDVHIPSQTLNFLCKELERVATYHTANDILYSISGICGFFDGQADFLLLKERLFQPTLKGEEPDRTEYGDFQTPTNLAKNVTTFLQSQGIYPQVVVEPTCGKGSFILAALSTWGTIEKVYAVEIHKPYVWEAKFAILHQYILHPSETKPDIKIFHADIFRFNFAPIVQQHAADEIVILGNPPWVTNAKLSTIESDNVPIKSNFKHHSGLEAMTGKGNFDIGEYITLMLFDAFGHSRGHLAFLVKNSIVKNIVYHQKSRAYAIANLQRHSIDSKKEFGVSVEASLFFCSVGSQPEYECSRYDFYSDNGRDKGDRFGWVGGKFVSHIDSYARYTDIDGVCPFEWRQGIKHDCSFVMEFNRANGGFINGDNQEFTIEKDMVYGILKSSDIQQTIVSETRKFTIITQQKVGQDTSYIEKRYPKTFSYLLQYKEQFSKRKSSIYKGKPAYSIFGVGEYSFKPYKVAISGLYKNYNFSLVLPQENKPVMLDDTCYFIGFDTIEYAIYSLILLDSPAAKGLLQAITFSDAKRMVTKDILMRIDMVKLAEGMNERAIRKCVEAFNHKYHCTIRTDLWEVFVASMKPRRSNQMSIFA